MARSNEHNRAGRDNIIGVKQYVSNVKSVSRFIPVFTEYMLGTCRIGKGDGKETIP